jgi:hypothetical protein
MALFSFWAITRAIWVKSAELAVHTFFVGFAVVTELMLITTYKKLVNDGVVVVLINNFTHLCPSIGIYIFVFFFPFIPSNKRV